MNRLLLVLGGAPVRSALWLLVALAIAAFAAGEGRAAFPGANGKIVFETNRDGNEEIYTMNADGTNRVDLTRNPADDTDPRWSADGARIVFASNRSGNYQIYTMNADGSGVTRVTHDSNDDRRPTWTADGRILFQNGDFPNRAIYSDRRRRQRPPAADPGLRPTTPPSRRRRGEAGSPSAARAATGRSGSTPRTPTAAPRSSCCPHRPGRRRQTSRRTGRRAATNCSSNASSSAAPSPLTFTSSARTEAVCGD